MSDIGSVRVKIFAPPSKRGRSSLGYNALIAFHRALVAAGEHASITSADRYQECDIAILYGVPNTGKGRKLHKSIYEQHRGIKVVLETPFIGRKVYLDGSSILAMLLRLIGRRRTPTNQHEYLRIGLNGAFFDDADFCNANSPPDRWEELSKTYNLKLAPYRTQGRHVLLVGQTPNDASLRGLDMLEWLEVTANSLKRLTDRPIVIRPHPLRLSKSVKRLHQSFARDRQISIDFPPRGTIFDALKDCWVSVCYSSSSAVDSLLAGVPSITLAPMSIAWPVTDHDLNHVNKPTLHPREQWLYDLAYAQWKVDEILSGDVWRHLRTRILQLQQSNVDTNKWR